MAHYNTSQFKNGLKVLIDGAPYLIIANEFEKPGKGQAFTRLTLKNYLNGRVIEKTYKSGHKVEQADIEEEKLCYLYVEGNQYHFMHPETYEQTSVDSNAIGETKKWLVEQGLYTVLYWNGRAISAAAESFIELAVDQCPPGVRGNTVSGAMKNATLSSGAVIKVPLFINQGDIIKVDTRDSSYVSRAATS